MDRAKSRPILQVDEDTVTVSQMIDYIRRRLMLEERPVRLKQMLRSANSQKALVVRFPRAAGTHPLAGDFDSPGQDLRRDRREEAPEVRRSAQRSRCRRAG